MKEILNGTVTKVPKMKISEQAVMAIELTQALSDEFLQLDDESSLFGTHEEYDDYVEKNGMPESSKLINNYMEFLMENYTPFVMTLALTIALKEHNIPLLPSRISDFDKFDSKYGDLIGLLGTGISHYKITKISE